MPVSEIIAAFIALSGVVTGIWGGFTTWRNAKSTGKKTDAEVRDSLIDRLEKDIERVSGERDADREYFKKEIDGLKERFRLSERREQIWMVWYQNLVLTWPNARKEDAPPCPPSENG